MRVTRKRGLIVRAAALCLLVLVAASVAYGANRTHKAAPVVLNYWDMQWGGPPLMNQIKKNVATFNATHPSIQVKFTELSWGDYTQKILSAVQAGAPPERHVLTTELVVRASTAPPSNRFTRRR